jgi:hypothetical protein
VSYLLLWSAPALILAGVVTGGVRATRTAAAIAAAIALLLALDAVIGTHARAGGATCGFASACPDAGAAIIGATFAIGAILISHLVGRWVRDGLDGLAETGAASRAH